MKKYNCDRGDEYCVLKEIMSDNIMTSSIEHGILNSKHNIGNGTLEDVCGCNSDCLYRDVANKKYTRRQLEQIKCISEYRDINNLQTMDEAALDWVTKGYAYEFDRVYTIKKNNHEIIGHSDLFNNINRKL